MSLARFQEAEGEGGGNPWRHEGLREVNGVAAPAASAFSALHAGSRDGGGSTLLHQQGANLAGQDARIDSFYESLVGVAVCLASTSRSTSRRGENMTLLRVAKKSLIRL